MGASAVLPQACGRSVRSPPMPASLHNGAFAGASAQPAASRLRASGIAGGRLRRTAHYVNLASSLPQALSMCANASAGPGAFCGRRRESLVFAITCGPAQKGERRGRATSPAVLRWRAPAIHDREARGSVVTRMRPGRRACRSLHVRARRSAQPNPSLRSSTTAATIAAIATTPDVEFIRPTGFVLSPSRLRRSRTR